MGNKYYTVKEVCNVLNINEPNFRSWNQRYNYLKNMNGDNKKHLFEKSKVDAIQPKVREFENLNIYFEKVVKDLNITPSSKYFLRMIPTNKSYLGIFLKRGRYYSKSDYEKIKDEIKFDIILSKNEISNYWELFKHKIKEINEIGIVLADYPETEKLYFSYVSKRIQSSQAAKKSELEICNILVRFYLYLTQELNDELFNSTPNEINLMISKINSSNDRFFYYFIKEVFAKRDIEKKKVFNIKQIYNPESKINKNKKVKEYYSKEEFKKMLNFLTDTNIHKKKSIDEIKKGNTNYIDFWIFCLISFNNAWRKSDVLNIPFLPIKEYKTLDNLEKNQLTKEEIYSIKSLIINSDLKISKTGEDLNFYASEKIMENLATAIYIKNGFKNEVTKKLINIKKTQYDKMAKEFFPEIHLYSLKLNRTLLSIIHSLNSKSRSSERNHTPSRESRNHNTIETTNLYIKLDQEDINFFSKQLMERGEFGYIYDALSQIIEGNEQTVEERTETIMELKRTFGSANKIENTSRFFKIMNYRNEEISSYIMGLKSKDIFILSKEIFEQNKISCEENIQCLVSEKGCMKDGNCFSCPFSIPNFYAMKNIVLNFEKQLDYYILKKESFSQGQHVKESNKIYSLMVTIMESMEKFGSEAVYSFFKGGEESFVDKVSKIDSIASRKTIGG